MAKRFVTAASAAALLVIINICLMRVASADSLLNSPHYHLDESALGGSGQLQSNSSGYKISEVIGDPAIGNSASTNYQVVAGSKTTNDPSLTFSINTTAPNFTDFTPTGTATATATFSVLDYTSYGYNVIVMGSPPSNGTHTITAMAANGAPITGTEQFGINLVANTVPTTVGANADHGLFGIGNAATNYNTPNQYRYVNGETIATGPKSSGLTNYTITYIVDVSSLTPGGRYVSGQTLICIGTY